jgi:hypothetical protein
VPRVKDENTNQFILDTSCPEYNEYLSEIVEAGLDAQYDKFLYAFDGDLKSVDCSHLVWSSADADVCDYGEALASLRALRIPPQKLGEISNKIDELSMQSAKEDMDTFRGNSMPLSEHLENSMNDGQIRARRRGQRGTTR